MKNSRGMSLIEIIVSLGVSSAILAVAVALIAFSIQNYRVASEKAEIRSIGNGIAQNLIRVFSFSNKIITRTATPITNSILLGQPSELRLGSWVDITTNPPGSWVSIANIRRDTGTGATAAAGRFSNLQRTGIFYILPTPTTSGVLFFDSGGGPAATPMSPSYDDIYFDRIVELQIDTPQYVTVGGVQYVKGFHVRVTTRHFLFNDKSRWRWCPVANAAAANCATGSYKDYKTDISIIIPNQIFRLPTAATSFITADRILGPLYFFPFKN